MRSNSLFFVNQKTFPATANELPQNSQKEKKNTELLIAELLYKIPDTSCGHTIDFYLFPLSRIHAVEGRFQSLKVYSATE